ncbi:MAG: hypothetical protein ACI9LT_002133 [Pseudoalteromonas distincta]|jgi:hypothetical protein
MTAPHEPTAGHARDFLARPLSALFWWGLPLLVGLSTNLLPLTPRVMTLVCPSRFPPPSSPCPAAC